MAADTLDRSASDRPAAAEMPPTARAAAPAARKARRPGGWPSRHRGARPWRAAAHRYRRPGRCRGRLARGGWLARAGGISAGAARHPVSHARAAPGGGGPVIAGPSGGGRGGSRPGRPDQLGEREGASRRADQGGQHVHRGGVRPGQRGEQTDHREAGQAQQAVAQPPRGRHPDAGGQDGQHHQDAGDQRGLVVRAEGGDGEVLHRRGRVVDGQAADGGQRRSLRAADPGDELSHAERHACGQQAGQHPEGSRATM